MRPKAPNRLTPVAERTLDDEGGVAPSPLADRPAAAGLVALAAEAALGSVRQPDRRSSACLSACLAAASLMIAACPGPQVEGPDAGPLALTVTAPVAPVADPGDAPPPDGALADGLPASVAAFDLGLLGVAGGLSGDIVVEVAAGLGALQLLVWGQPDAQVVLWRATAPDGTPVVDDVEPTGLSATQRAFARGFPAQVFSVNRVFGSRQSGGFLVPNTPAVPAASGTWRLVVGHFRVVDDVATPVDRPVRAVLLASPSRSQGTLPLNVHLTGARGLSATTAPDDAFLQDALTVIRDTYAQAAIEVGPVSYLDVGADYQVVELAADECGGGDLPTLLGSGAAPSPGLDLFVIEAFRCVIATTEVGDSIGGLAGALPGPAYVQGSTHAGVTIATQFAAGSGTRLGRVAAHEMAHFLGLFHTRESNVFGADPVYDELEDTLEDADSVRDNLMFFAVDESTALTDDQSTVLRSHPLVR